MNYIAKTGTYCATVVIVDPGAMGTRPVHGQGVAATHARREATDEEIVMALRGFKNKLWQLCVFFQECILWFCYRYNLHC